MEQRFRIELCDDVTKVIKHYSNQTCRVGQNHSLELGNIPASFPPQLERWQQRQWAIIYLFKVEDTRRLCDGGGALHQDNLGNCSLVTIYHGLSPGHRHLHHTNTGNHRVRSGESIWTLNPVHSCVTLRPVSLLSSIIVDSHRALGGWQVMVDWVRS